MLRCLGLDALSGIQTDVSTPPVRDTAIIGSFEWMMGGGSRKVWRLTWCQVRGRCRNLGIQMVRLNMWSQRTSVNQVKDNRELQPKRMVDPAATLHFDDPTVGAERARTRQSRHGWVAGAPTSSMYSSRAHASERVTGPTTSDRLVLHQKSGCRGLSGRMYD